MVLLIIPETDKTLARILLDFLDNFVVVASVGFLNYRCFVDHLSDLPCLSISLSPMNSSR